MLGIKVKLQNAENTKRELISKKLLNFNYKPIKKKDHIIFPISKKEGKYEFINIEFENKLKKSYKEYFSKEVQDKLPSSYDIMGNIIIIEISDELIEYEKQIGESLLKTHTSVKTILKKSGIHSGEFRTQKLKYLVGINTKETEYKENGVIIKLDVELIYFSSRLSTERKRIYNEINNDEEILVMFSGAAPYPVVLSKNTNARKIIGIEKNPVGHKYGLINLKLNKIKNVDLINGDVIDIVPKLKQKFDRIIMPLPKDADTFLDIAFTVVRKGTIIHMYDFEHESELDLGEKKVLDAAKKANINVKILKTVKCGQYSPGKFRICIDFKIL
jgi:tRNA (guanine37-N1)-methyltransferase